MTGWDDTCDTIIDVANKLMRYMDDNGIDTRDGSLACGLLYSIVANEDPKRHEIIIGALIRAAALNAKTNVIVRKNK